MPRFQGVSGGRACRAGSLVYEPAAARQRRGGAVICHAGFSGDGPSSSGQGGDPEDSPGDSFDFGVLSSRIQGLREAETAECATNWRLGRCTHHTVALLDVWVRRLRLHGESVACGSHTGECYIVDGLCGRSTESNLYPDDATDVPATTARCIRQCVNPPPPPPTFSLLLILSITPISVNLLLTYPQAVRYLKLFTRFRGSDAPRPPAALRAGTVSVSLFTSLSSSRSLSPIRTYLPGGC